MIHYLLRLMVLLGLSFAIASCGMLRKAPGATVVRVHNHSGRTVLIEGEELRAGRSGTFVYPADRERVLVVFWNGCVHAYVGSKERPAGFRERDWMLRGEYTVQLEPDGSLYLLPPGTRLPADTAAIEQPEGFPLRPREGSTCVN
jgi:hypothetical protein